MGRSPHSSGYVAYSRTLPLDFQNDGTLGGCKKLLGGSASQIRSTSSGLNKNHKIQHLGAHHLFVLRGLRHITGRGPREQADDVHQLLGEGGGRRPFEAQG